LSVGYTALHVPFWSFQEESSSKSTLSGQSLVESEKPIF
jgi:hypothetical protein